MLGKKRRERLMNQYYLLDDLNYMKYTMNIIQFSS